MIFVQQLRHWVGSDVIPDISCIKLAHMHKTTQSPMNRHEVTPPLTCFRKKAAEPLLWKLCTLFSVSTLAYRRLPEELILGIVFAENEPRVTLKGPGCLNLQYDLVVLQAPLCRRHVCQAVTCDGWFQGCRCIVKWVFLPRPRMGWTSRSAQFSWSLQWAVCTNMWHTSRAVAPEETHTDLLWLSSLYTFISCTQGGVIRIHTRTDLGTVQVLSILVWKNV